MNVRKKHHLHARIKIEFAYCMQQPHLSCQIVEDASEGRGHQAAEGDEGEGDAEGARPLGLLRVPVGDHRHAPRVREGGAHALEGDEEDCCHSEAE